MPKLGFPKHCVVIFGPQSSWRKKACLASMLLLCSNWFDNMTWYPLGRWIGGTGVPGLPYNNRSMSLSTMLLVCSVPRTGVECLPGLPASVGCGTTYVTSCSDIHRCTQHHNKRARHMCVVGVTIQTTKGNNIRITQDTGYVLSSIRLGCSVCGDIALCSKCPTRDSTLSGLPAADF